MKQTFSDWANIMGQYFRLKASFIKEPGHCDKGPVLWNEMPQLNNLKDSTPKIKKVDHPAFRKTLKAALPLCLLL